MKTLRERTALEGATTKFSVSSAPQNGRCMWYALARIVRVSKEKWMLQYAVWLRRHPDAWNAIRTVRNLRCTRKQYLRKLHTGEEWGDESVLHCISQRYNVRFLLIGLNDHDILTTNVFPFGRPLRHNNKYAALRFVHNHYDNVKIDGQYVMSSPPPIVRLFWNLQ